MLFLQLTELPLVRGGYGPLFLSIDAISNEILQSCPLRLAPAACSHAFGWDSARKDPPGFSRHLVRALCTTSYRTSCELFELQLVRTSKRCGQKLDVFESLELDLKTQQLN